MIKDARQQSETGDSRWIDRYSLRHKLTRITEFPGGVKPPQKVRIYSRGDHYLLQFWDPHQKKTLNQRIDGDLIEAIVRAREIDGRLVAVRKSGVVENFSHIALVERYLKDLALRCNAGEIDSKTVERYRAAIEKHYLDFCAHQAEHQFRHIQKIDRDFQLAFSGYLNRKLVSPNGHPAAKKIAMSARGQQFVLDCVKAMYVWAANPQKGGLLPFGFENPFLGRHRQSAKVVRDRMSAPQITVPMAVELIKACDLFQLRIMGPLVMFGLRPSELGWLFDCDVTAEWVAFNCHPELDYFTKGRQNKRFPLMRPLNEILAADSSNSTCGLVFRNRKALNLSVGPTSLQQTVAKYRAHCDQLKCESMKRRQQVRDLILRNDGFLSYDQVKREFDRLSKQLGWSPQPTLKDLRHLFSTCLENAGVPDYFRKYLMGQSFGRSPIVTYTHVTEEKLNSHYRRAIEQEMPEFMDAMETRWRTLTETASLLS